MADYSQIDRSNLLSFLFYPRRDFTPCPEGAFDLPVPVGDQVSIFCRFYAGDRSWPWLLYFHGNGEVVSDYDEIAPLYHQKEINLSVADYRGYGASGGSPNFSSIFRDAHPIFRGVQEELIRRGLEKDLWVMGRSMGSLPAVDLAGHYPDRIKGIVIESGFASVTRLMRHLNLPAGGIDLEPIEQERLAMVRKISIPALIIHGELDTLVPLKEARDLHQLLGSARKKLVIIPDADHNTIMFTGLEEYFAEIREFIEDTRID